MLDPTLFVVATPIGHRDDISVRAIEVLRQVDRIYAEDTRHSQPLLQHHGINSNLWSLHEHNEEQQIDSILQFLQSPACAALITDAGTPLISDPGYRLVRACHAAGIRVTPVPGASALTAALSVCGLPTDRFEFLGFVPRKSAARRALFRSLVSTGHTLVWYEAPHRVIDCLHDMVGEFGGDRPLALARELTKRFETVVTGRCEDVLSRLRSDPVQQKGEFVLMVGAPDRSLDGYAQATGVELNKVDKMLGTLMQHLPIKTAARCVADIQGINKRSVYDRALALQEKQANKH